MKRITLLIALVAIAVTSIAQDIIVTRNQTRIEAKILEISDTVVKFNKSALPNGPTFILPVREVYSITLADGSNVDLLSSTTESEQIQPRMPRETRNDLLPRWTDTLYEEFPIRLKTGKEIMFRTGTPIEVKNGRVYYGDVRLDEKEYEEIISFCEDANYYYNKSKRHEAWGTFWGISASVVMVSSLFLGIANFSELNSKLHENPMYVGVWLPLLATSGLALISIGPTNRANRLKDQANMIFNQKCAWGSMKKYSADMSLSASVCGIGLTLTF